MLVPITYIGFVITGGLFASREMHVRIGNNNATNGHGPGDMVLKISILTFGQSTDSSCFLSLANSRFVSFAGVSLLSVTGARIKTNNINTRNSTDTFLILLRPLSSSSGLSSSISEKVQLRQSRIR